MANPLFYGSSAIYLDYAAMAPPSPEAIEAMKEAAMHAWGNPHSLHSMGARARHALDEARTRVAEYAGAANPHEIVFTASGRDAIAKGLALARRLAEPGPVASSRLEHPELIARVEEARPSVHWLSLPEGLPNRADEDALRRAALVAISACNHELGTLLPVDAMDTDAVRFIDATQAAPWISLQTYADDRTFLVFSGAKLGAPGVGVLRVPHRLFYEAREHGISLESESPPWLSAIGLGAACAARSQHRDAHLARACAASAALLDGMRSLEPSLLVNGAPASRLGPILNVSFPNCDGKDLVEALSMRGVCIGHTAACRARREDASPVVRAAYPDDPARARQATRWSLSELTTADEICRALDALKGALGERRRPCY